MARFFSWTGGKSFLFGGIFLFQTLERTFQSLKRASQSLECTYQSLKPKFPPYIETFVQRERGISPKGLRFTVYCRESGVESQESGVEGLQFTVFRL